MTPKVSVIIPTYNEEACVDGSLSTILDQTYDSYEVIVVDDGSTDGTVARVKRYPVRFFQRRRGGPAAARNFGAEQAQGDILVFVDDDQTFDRRFLETLVKPIEEGRVVGTDAWDEYVRNLDNRWARYNWINSGLPDGRRMPAQGTESLSYRAILKSEFMRVGGFDVSAGYADHNSLYQKLGPALVVRGAICYHNNPATLVDTFKTANWCGRSECVQGGLRQYLHWCVLNSLRHGIRTAVRYREPFYIPFKVLFDFAVWIGLFQRRFRLGGYLK